MAELLPAADRALEWMESYGDRDGDGFLEYERATDRGLRNQGWKDSFDGSPSPTAGSPTPRSRWRRCRATPTQAYVARSQLAVRAGDEVTARRWTERAEALRTAFNRHFWLPERGWFALGLDRDKRPIDSLASNMGHCLWTGIIDEDKAAAVAEHLLSPEMFTGWGVRTLASSMSAYNPMSYHNGSVWPHDNALLAAGLMRYGFVEHAQRIAGGLIEASSHFDGRLPELFCGFDRTEFESPIPYPTSCSPQAWAAASPLLLLRTLLRLDPAVPDARVWLAPELPAELGDLTLERLALAGARLTVGVTSGVADLQGLPTAHRDDRPAVVHGAAARLRGVEDVCADLVDGLVARGHEVTLIGAGPAATRAGRDLTSYPEPPSGRLGEPLPEVLHTAATARILAELDVDLVHDHTLAGPLLARGRSMRTVVTMHGPVVGEPGEYYRQLGDTVSLVAISAAQRLAAPDLAWRGTVLGRIHPHKGVHLAIDASRAAGLPIVVAGKCTEAVELEYFRSAIEPRLGPDVTMFGVADATAKRELLARAAVLVFPILWDEPFGMVMIEAMACGTPVVALRRGAVPEVVDDGVTGVLCDDPVELPAAIATARGLSPAACRRHVATCFDARTMVAGYEAVYRDVLAAPEPLRRGIGTPAARRPVTPAAA
ncbi:glycosyltransferase [Modestobacter sp. NPDC049651]|uniref:glycosyltransferase n=1 Tax=unclassified Modestobacter TaxID=2643866 RepID=UPI0033D1D471